MGLADGAPCTLDGKAGSCHGPHPSRMTCQPGQPSSQGPGDAAAGSGAGSAAGSATGSAAGSATGGDAVDHAPSNPEPAAAPGHKRGCAVATPGSAALVAHAYLELAVVARWLSS
jgi:hypothetical protein